jgi:hypothetical protein
MDRETKENYVVVIQAKDMAGQMGGLSGTTTVSITLSDENDSPPRFANRKRPSLFSSLLIFCFSWRQKVLYMYVLSFAITVQFFLN